LELTNQQGGLPGSFAIKKNAGKILAVIFYIRFFVFIRQLSEFLNLQVDV
jgi:hypothetical protein